MLSALILAAAVAGTPGFPSKTLRMVTSAEGGGANFAARLVAQALPERAGFPVVVENRGGGVLAGEVVARAEPDGHTMLVYGNTFWLLPLLRRQVPYDPIADFSPVILLTRAPSVLVVHPSLPAASVQELVALAQRYPGKLNYASGAAGGVSHLAAELFCQMARIQVARIPFRGTGPGMTALMGNQVQIMFATWGAVRHQVQAGQVRALAVTSDRRFELAPHLPTVAQSGLPGYQATAMFGVFVPARTPRKIVAILNEHIAQVLAAPAVRKRFSGIGAEVVGGTPGEFEAAIRQERATMGKLIRDLGLRDN